MDGFEQRKQIYVVGATNDVSTLDKAALRPGRFDKIINVPVPDLDDRTQLFDFYMQKIKLEKDINSSILAKMTPGFTGAEIENMVNLAAIQAVDEEKQLTKEVLEEARDRIILGIKRKDKKVGEKEKLQNIAYEAGKAVVCLSNNLCREQFHKIVIVPRGRKNSHIINLDADTEPSKQYLLSLIKFNLAGPIALRHFLGSDSVSAKTEEDLSRATQIARRAVKEFAMDKEYFGLLAIESGKEVSHKLSEYTLGRADLAVDQLMKQAEKETTDLLESKAVEVKNLMQALANKEELTREETEKAMKGI